MKHPHAGIIKALADDESLTLWRKTRLGQWDLILYSKINHVLSSGGSVQFHLGPTPPPRMIETPYGSYPEPLREAPELGVSLWFASSSGTPEPWGAWHGYPSETDILCAGVLHLTKEAAKQQAQVELKRRMAELGWEKS